MAAMLDSKFTVGCDPEVFIVDETGRPVSAEGLIPGTKEEPYRVPFGAIQVDGMAAEFNIDPVNTFDDFRHHIRSVLQTMKDMLPTGYAFLIKPSVVFDEEVWKKTPLKAKELGCMPDFNAWTASINPPPRNYDMPTLRTAAGHIHIGWTKDADLSDVNHIVNCNDLVKQLDWYLGGWSVPHDQDGAIRRSLYGKAGACRYKDYGVEYRVLSNFWLVDDTVMETVWDRLVSAITQMSSTFIPELSSMKYNKRLIKMIETSIIDDQLMSNYHYPLIDVR